MSLATQVRWHKLLLQFKVILTHICIYVTTSIFKLHLGDDDTTQHMELTSVQCPTSTSVDNPSLPHNGFVYSDSPIESFVADDDDSHMSEEQEDEYFALARRGIANVMDTLFLHIQKKQDLYNGIHLIICR